MRKIDIMIALKYFNSSKLDKLQYQKNRTTKIKGLLLMIILCDKTLSLQHSANFLSIFYNMGFN